MNKKIMPTKFTADFSIYSGTYTATFYGMKDFDCIVYKEYNIYGKIEIILGWIFIGAFILFFAPIIVWMISSFGIWFPLWYFVVVGIIGIFSLSGLFVVGRCLESLKYDYILYDLRRSGAFISYESKDTGTISYSYGINEKTRLLSVYKRNVKDDMYDLFK